MNRRDFLNIVSKATMAVAAAPTQLTMPTRVPAGVAAIIPDQTKTHFYNFVETLGAMTSRMLGRAIEATNDSIDGPMEHFANSMMHMMGQFTPRLLDFQIFLGGVKDESLKEFAGIASHPLRNEIIDKVVASYYKTIRWQADIFRSNEGLEFLNELCGMNEASTEAVLKKIINGALDGGESFMRALDNYTDTKYGCLHKKLGKRELERFRDRIKSAEAPKQEELESFIENTCAMHGIKLEKIPNRPCVFTFKAPAESEEKLDDILTLLMRHHGHEGQIHHYGWCRGRINADAGSNLHAVLENARGEMHKERYMDDLEFVQGPGNCGR